MACSESFESGHPFYSIQYHEAILLEKKGLFKEAANTFSVALRDKQIELDINAYPSTLYHLAQLKYLLNDRDNAKALINKCLEVSPHHQLALTLKESMEGDFYFEGGPKKRVWCKTENFLWNNRLQEEAQSGDLVISLKALKHWIGLFFLNDKNAISFTSFPSPQKGEDFEHFLIRFLSLWFSYLQCDEIFFDEFLSPLSKKHLNQSLEGSRINLKTPTWAVSCRLKGDDFTIVVSRYREDLEWTKDFEPNILVYNKGGDGKGHVQLPNIGREFQTYLYYIIEHYDSLPEKILFLQGNPFEHQLYSIYEYALPSRDFLTLFNDEKPFSDNHRLDPIHHEIARRKFICKDDKEWFWDRYIKKKKPHLMRSNYGAQFSVSRHLIRKNNKAYYKDLLDLSLQSEIKMVNSLNNFCIGVLFEMFWFYIFNEPDQEGQWRYS